MSVDLYRALCRVVLCPAAKELSIRIRKVYVFDRNSLDPSEERVMNRSDDRRKRTIDNVWYSTRWCELYVSKQ